MPRSRLIIVVLIVIALAVATPLVLNRYYLTPSSQQHLIEEQNQPTLVTTP